MGSSWKQTCLLLRSFLQRSKQNKAASKPSFPGLIPTKPLQRRGQVSRASLALLGFLPSSLPAPAMFLAPCAHPHRAIQGAPTQSALGPCCTNISSLGCSFHHLSSFPPRNHTEPKGGAAAAGSSRRSVPALCALSSFSTQHRHLLQVLIPAAPTLQPGFLRARYLLQQAPCRPMGGQTDVHHLGDVQNRATHVVYADSHALECLLYSYALLIITINTYIDTLT